MNKELRQNVVRAMEYLVRSTTNEELSDDWFSDGVEDGYIEYEDFKLTEDFDEYYLEDKNFKNLLSIFLKTMSRAWKDGGLYCDEVTSCDKTDYHLE